MARTVELVIELVPRGAHARSPRIRILQLAPTVNAVTRAKQESSRPGVVRVVLRERLESVLGTYRKGVEYYEA